MSKQSPNCSVVIRAFNEEKHIARLLTGIFEQTVVDLEVIVVDSGSTDATRSIVRGFPVQLVSISPEEFTFGRALNLGCRQAQGDFIVLASAHVYPVYRDWLERLLEPIQDRSVALTYGKQRGKKGTRFSEAQHFARLYPAESVSNQESAFCNNANAAIRRELWLAHHYDEQLSGLEDLEWAMWAKGNDLKVVYVAEAEVIHVHNETPTQVINRYRREAIALKRLRPHEHFGLLDCVRLYTSNVTSDLKHALLERPPAGNWPDVFWFRFLQFWGTYRGFAHRGPLSDELERAFYYPRGLSEPVTGEKRKVEPIAYTGEPTES